ncbi:hypothetical protein DAPPUDRAFT_45783 [Daphnia pulex]|uniref:Importin subunit alpha n=1 Tax=Daphnia pulex TaxID=6669 RepID=E9G4M9_DAPPU|nr:hypothetical protein DAPPUDRAFT_45783 [Daphnia pulex]|eukprot:EFX85528.1 hypothetical protein DAPPUDRAFT_45783 [Daphnia pulex]
MNLNHVGINNGDENEIFTATHAVTILTRNFYPVIDILINANVVPKLVEFLSRVNNPDLQLESAWALANIASGTSDQIEAVVSAGAVAGFISLLGSPHPVLVEIAVWTLGNIARNDLELTNHVIEQGIIEPLLIFINKPDISDHFSCRSLFLAVSNIFRHLCRYLNPTVPTVRQLLPALFHLIYKNDKYVLAKACMALCYLTVTNDVVQEVVDAGVVPRLVFLLDNNDFPVNFPALRTIGNIVTGIQTTVAGAYPLLAKLLMVNSSTKTFWYEATVFASRIADCNAAETQDLITSNVILPLEDVLIQGDFKRQEETALVISHITLGGNVIKTATLFKFDFVSLCSLMCILLCTLLCTLLKATEPKTIVVVLDGLALILEASKKMGDLEKVSLHVKKCGGLDCIKALKSNENVEIHHKSLAILERYFPTDVIFFHFYGFGFLSMTTTTRFSVCVDNLTITKFLTFDLIWFLF